MDDSQNLINDLSDRVSALTAALNANNETLRLNNNALRVATVAIEDMTDSLKMATAIIEALMSAYATDLVEYGGMDRDTATALVSNIITDARGKYLAGKA